MTYAEAWCLDPTTLAVRTREGERDADCYTVTDLASGRSAEGHSLSLALGRLRGRRR